MEQVVKMSLKTGARGYTCSSYYKEKDDYLRAKKNTTVRAKNSYGIL